MLTGRMPRNGLLPYSRYDTPNVHLCTVADFRKPCEEQNLDRVREIFVVPPSRQIHSFLANWRAGSAIFRLRHGGQSKGARSPRSWRGNCLAWQLMTFDGRQHA